MNVTIETPRGGPKLAKNVDLSTGQFDPHALASPWTFTPLPTSRLDQVSRGSRIFVDFSQSTAMTAVLQAWPYNDVRSFIVRAKDGWDIYEFRHIDPVHPFAGSGTLNTPCPRTVLQLHRRLYHRARGQLLVLAETTLDLLDNRSVRAVVPGAALPALTAAVQQIKTVAQAVTNRTKDYANFEQQATQANLGAAVAALGTALAAVPDFAAHAAGISAVQFPPTIAQNPLMCAIEHATALDKFMAAFNLVLLKAYKVMANATQEEQTVGDDIASSVAFFFQRFEAIYNTSTRLAAMSTSSTGRASFQRGVHGGVLEAHLRSELADRVAPLRVSTGAIIGAPAKDQLDLIIWDPAAAHTFVQVGDYVYVPSPAVRGILELKGGVNDVGEVARRLVEIEVTVRALNRLAGSPRVVATLGIVVADPGLYDTVIGRSGGKVVPLFRQYNGIITPNTDAYDVLMDFIRRVQA